MIFDHLVLVVKDLPSASRHFDRLGFTVSQGGEHPGWGTHNALIGLQDGSYLELLAATIPWHGAILRMLGRTGLQALAMAGKPLFHSRFTGHLAGGEGLADFALLSIVLESDLQATRSRGVDLAGPFDGSRRKPDGTQISWRSAAPGSADLPFLIEDLTPRKLRVPSGAACHHTNGVTGIAALSIACRDLAPSADQYSRMLGLEPAIETGRDGQPACASFRLERTELVLFTANSKMAMRKRAAVPHSTSLNSSSGPLSLLFFPTTGFELQPV